MDDDHDNQRDSTSSIFFYYKSCMLLCSVYQVVIRWNTEKHELLDWHSAAVAEFNPTKPAKRLILLLCICVPCDI